jgi:hypothetical protein
MREAKSSRFKIKAKSAAVITRNSIRGHAHLQFAPRKDWQSLMERLYNGTPSKEQLWILIKVSFTSPAVSS